jgi:hypothetical protein
VRTGGWAVEWEGRSESDLLPEEEKEEEEREGLFEAVNEEDSELGGVRARRRKEVWFKAIAGNEEDSDKTRRQNRDRF